MKQQLNLTFIDNESHGYVKLSRYDLQGFGIDIKEFSKHSYYNLDNACYYFEEDCDGSKLWSILKNKGYEIIFNKEYVGNNYFNKPTFSKIN